MIPIFLLVIFTCMSEAKMISRYAFAKTKYTTVLSEAAVEIVEKFYIHHQAPLQILSSSFTYDTSALYLVNEILFRVRGSTTYMHWNNIIPMHSKRSSYNIFVIDSYYAFQKIYNKFSYRTTHFDGYFLIVISSNLEMHLEASLERIFDDCYNRYIMNVNVLVARPGSNLKLIDMYTYFPFVEKSCRTMRPVLYNTFENGTFWKNSIIFPSKVQNFQQCSVTVVTWHYPPHMILQNLPGDHMEYQGIDGNILHTIAEKMNFSLKFDLTAGYRGNVLWNGSATGALGVIINRQANITICAHGFMFARPTKISASVNYFSTGLVFAIPPLGYYTSFEKLFLIFSKAVWYLTIGFYFGAICIIFISKACGKKYLEFIAGAGNNSPYSNIFSITTGTPIPSAPKRNFARFLFTVWTLATLVIRNSYQGSLFDYLQKYEERPNSPKLLELLKNGYQLHVPEDCLAWFSELSDFKHHVEVMNESLWDYFHEMQMQQTKVIVLTTEIQMDYYNHRHQNKGEIRRLDERLFYTPQSIFYPRYSFLREPIDWILEDCLAGGLISHWVKIFLDKPLSTTGSAHKPISFADLQGFCLLASTLYLASLITFIFEWISGRFNVYKIFMEYLTLKLCLK